ncbi:MAG: DUF1648 domain-containing protein [Betaproteobacteria bacterium]|nr:DUF1648 domain-containing protein [Betaproteobacteria bacterium]
MLPLLRLPWFVLFVACAAAFVWLTSMRLPATVASHFDGSGAANGFMARGVYVGLMLGLLVGLPALMVGLTWLSVARPKARLNLPNEDYWLAPERRAGTIAYLRAGILWFGTLLVSFLCYAHWLVVLANEVHPARLANAWFIGGLVVFLAALLAWLIVFLGHFRRGA